MPPFHGGATGVINVGTVSASATIDANSPHMQLTLSGGAGPVFVRWGVGAQIATTSDYPVLPNTTQLVVKQNANTVAAVTASGTATLYAIPGRG